MQAFIILSVMVNVIAILILLQGSILGIGKTVSDVVPGILFGVAGKFV